MTRSRSLAALALKAAMLLPLACTVAPALAEPVVERGRPVSALARMVARQGGIMLTETRGIGMTPAVATSRRTLSRTAPDVFGSVALPVVRTALDARWRHGSQGIGSGLGASADALAASLRGATPAEQAAAVNAWVNTHVTFVADRAGPDGDDWAPAARTLRTGRGDCEDFAIAKLALLRAAGIAAGDLYLVVAYDMVRRQDHAMLVVRTPDAMLLLDSATDRILDATMASDYRPILSFSAGRAWVHGYATDQSVQRYAALDPQRPDAS